MQDTGRLPRVLLLSVVRCLRFILSPTIIWGALMDNQIFTQSYNAIHHATELGKPEWRAVALIIQAYQGHEIVDFYGAAPFSDWRVI